MYSYIKGMVSFTEVNHVVIDNNGMGFLIYVANPYAYKIGEEVLVYVYQQIREEENTLYGFKTLQERELFLKLISVKGLGPKMALPMLSGDNQGNIYEAIESGNVNYLKKFPKIGDKVARQIILDLKGKLASDEKGVSADYTELTETLKSLGYKPVDIKKVLPKIDANKKLQEQVKDALKMLLK